jgi:hypothetical protein
MVVSLSGMAEVLHCRLMAILPDAPDGNAGLRRERTDKQLTAAARNALPRALFRFDSGQYRS